MRARVGTNRRLAVDKIMLHGYHALVEAGFERVHEAPYLNEFALRVPEAATAHASLLDRGVLAGLPLADLGVGPVLVLQGDRDGTVGWRYNMKAIAKLFPGSRIEYLPGAGHQLANESAAIRSRYAASIDAWLFA